MLRALIVAVLVLGLCAVALACGGRTCTCHGDVCEDCSGTAPTARASDVGGPAAFDATIESTASGTSDDRDARGLLDDASQGRADAEQQGDAAKSATDVTASDAQGSIDASPNMGLCPNATLVLCPNGFCADLANDSSHCGSCAHQCSLGTACSGGICQAIVTGADSCVCSMLYGPCGALSPCGCCPGVSLYCASNSYCFFVAH
jgi:hypothetical protein